MEWLLLAGVGFLGWLFFRPKGDGKGERNDSTKNAMPKPTLVLSTSDPQPLLQPRGGKAERHANRGSAQWVQPGQAVDIRGYTITAGMIYVGRSLPSRSGGPENCLIDPSLRLTPGDPDKSGETMSYWPSYAKILPHARRAYIEWLASGRKDPDIGIGYVFLFFYGLERRYLVDGARQQEGAAILAEVRRLMAIYGGNHSFESYATRLLDAAAIMDGPVSRPQLSPTMRNGYEMPMATRLYLSHRLADKAPFDADDALTWILSLPETYLRTPATRCFDEFVQLWRLRFNERHPTGLRVTSPPGRLELSYRAASNTFTVDVTPMMGDVRMPDIAEVKDHLGDLRGMVDACTDALDQYSRLLGRKPGARGSVEAALLLPKDLTGGASGKPLKSITDRLEAVFAGRPIAPITVANLIDILGLERPSGSRLTAAVCNQVGVMLDKLDIAFEPDRRYESNHLVYEGRAVLFKSPGAAAVDAGKASYKAAKTLVEVTSLAAGSDGNVSSVDYESVRNDLRDVPDLSTTERMRLLAYAALMLNDSSRQQAVMKNLAKLPEATRQKLAKSAIGAILADGHASPGEVKFIEQLYKALGYPADDVYAALHRGSVVIDEPVVVAPEEASSGVPIPREPRSVAPASGIRIDAARLQRLRQETSEVSALLAGIFVEEDDTPAASAPVAASSKGNFKGLDAAHGELLSAVLASGMLDRATFGERARILRLLPDGAIETINEWGFDNLDEAILEGEDPISIADHLRAQLEERRETTE